MLTLYHTFALFLLRIEPIRDSIVVLTFLLIGSYCSMIYENQRARHAWRITRNSRWSSMTSVIDLCLWSEEMRGRTTLFSDSEWPDKQAKMQPTCSVHVLFIVFSLGEDQQSWMRPVRSAPTMRAIRLRRNTVLVGFASCSIHVLQHWETERKEEGNDLETARIWLYILNDKVTIRLTATGMSTPTFPSVSWNVQNSMMDLSSTRCQ